jgi:hypothetical protein
MTLEIKFTLDVWEVRKEISDFNDDLSPYFLKFIILFDHEVYIKNDPFFP